MTKFVTYGDGRRRTVEAHVGKNTRRVFVGGKYVGTERKLGIPGGRYRSLDPATVAKALRSALTVPVIPGGDRFRSAVLERDGRCVIPGGDRFRSAVLERDGRCVVTGTPADTRIYSKGKSVALVQAAHIKPRKLCGPGEYWDVDNGFAMRADIHAAFDAGLFTISDDGRIIVCRLLVDEELYPPTILTELTEGQRRYLRGHREWSFGNWARWAM